MQQFLCYWLAVCALVASVCSAGEANTPKPSDVRVVIDISGSMKKTDPANLRKPAVDLIVRLLPDQSKAGIWTFGQSVNMLVPHRVVDAQWRSEGTNKAKAINSVAMFTNIGAALEAAAADHSTPSSDYNRHLILLTDGVVDINKEAVVNLNERKRILTELLPALKASDYRIHTIALSADADQELMKKLSIATDGVFEVADTADELMATFLRIFDQVVPAERVPLDENGFLVDSSIQEFTALIFRRAEVPASVIIAPDGKEYSATDPANNVNWYRTDKYDLITVQQPVAGQWKVKTEMAPGSRVTVVSNLQLLVEPLKSNIKPNQNLDLIYSFVANKETVTNKDFLNLLTGEAFITPAKSKETRTISLSTPANEKGIFTGRLDGFSDLGAHDIKILIDGKTFKREFVHRVNVSESAFRVEKRIDEAEGKKTYVYTASADLEVVDVNATKVTAVIKNSQDNNLERELNAIEQSRWEFSFSPVEAARYSISMFVTGMQLDGSPLQETIVLDDFAYPDEASLLAGQAASSEVSAESSAAASEVAEVAEVPASDKSSNTLIYVAIGLANLLVLVLGFVAYRVIAGKGHKDELAEMEKTLNTSAVDLSKSAKDKAATAPAAAQAGMSPSEGSAMPGMEDNSGMDLSMPDDLMADNLFPLDSMEEDSSKDKS
uniref:vWA domain-containing protein n=1 Tax=Cellvibrio fontiphilus TaxID=1815559 RepID=UPI002B4C09DD|nr:vWA domain-containing protein [Cellvibrio fontiphilus]